MDDSIDDLRRLASLRGQATDRLPTPPVPGRGRHRAVRRQRPPGRATASAGGARPSRRGCTNSGTASAAWRTSPPAAAGAARTRTRDWPPTSAPSSSPTPTPTRSCKSSRRYTNLSAAEVREALLAEKGYPEERLAQRADDARHPQPHELPPQADPEGQAAEEDQGDRRHLRQRQGGYGEEARDDPEALEISMDTKAKVALGDYVRGGKSRTDSAGKVAKGWDHDPPAKEKLVPLRDPDGGDRGVDAALRRARDERRLGGCLAGVVARVRAGHGDDQAAGDLPGQRPEELRPADAVPEADGASSRTGRGW